MRISAFGLEEPFTAPQRTFRCEQFSAAHSGVGERPLFSVLDIQGITRSVRSILNATIYRVPE